MNNIQVVANTSFLGETGYNAHSQNFFVNLNKLIPTRIRNYTYVPKFTEFEKQHLHMLIEQDFQDPPYKIGTPFNPNPNDTIVNIVLNESHHYFFYDEYKSPMIAYNVWESTRQTPEFFNRILEYDQFWCPTECQRQWTIDQGYPEDRVKVVPEGVNGKIFLPGVSSKEKDELFNKYNIPEQSFVFMIFGRFDYRKSIQEMIAAWHHKFGNIDNCYLVISVDNPFSTDKLKSTEDRLKHYKLEHERIRILHFPPRYEYIKWLQYGSCLLSCSRAEGWNLPLIEALACGTPVICSDWGPHLEFANGIAYKVNVPNELPPKHVYMLGDDFDIGVWGEPDFDHLESVMQYVYKNYTGCKTQTLYLSRYLRELYTWDNAARKAETHINKLVELKPYIFTPKKEVSENEIKLNLGCGTDIKPGYINIDRYNNTGKVDLKSDIGDLPFGDGTVDEIFASHIFEHIGLMDMYAVLTEWRRVLADKGRFILRLPNLEHEVNIWLNAPDDKKWLEVGKIFGGQTHDGNTHFCGFNIGSLKSLLERFNFYIDHIGLANRGYGEEIQCTAIKLPDKNFNPSKYICHFVDGPFIDIQGGSEDKAYYQIDFLDPDNEASVHQTTLSINNWTRPHRKYFTNWLVKVRRNGIYKFKHAFDLKNKKVLISFDTKSIGDSIAFIPAVEEFRKKHQCNIIVSTFWNKLFEGHPTYKYLKFIEPGTVVKNLYASYTIGCYEGDFNKNINDWRTVPLGKVATDTLGLEYKEIMADLAIKPGSRDIKEKYVTLSEFSTFQCKFWNRENGWQTIVDYLNSIGYRVVVVSKEETNLKNIINRTNRSIENSITTIYHSECMLTVSTGPAWIAWALRKPVVLISGFSAEFAEFQTNCERVINKSVCNSCFNDVSNNFDRGQWDWCPRHKGTPHQYECTKEIFPEMVIERINKTLKIGE